MAEELKQKKTSSMLDENLVRRIADLLRETGLNELEIETDSVRIRASLGGGMPSTHIQVAGPQATAAPVQLVSVKDSPENHPGAVKSPMVGTAYISPEPGAANFVKVGDQVKMGQTLLIIEAMKVMNPIPAPKAGTVRQILVQDTQPVEFGDPLLIIE